MISWSKHRAEFVLAPHELGTYMAARLHCWIVIGGHGVRKGSVIRALTGIADKRAKNVRIELEGGQWLEFDYVSVASINEPDNRPAPSQWVQQQFSKKISGRINILIPFRTEVIAGFDAHDYVRELDKSDARIESILTLGEDNIPWTAKYGVPFAAVPNSQWIPTASSAKAVRELWRWA